MELGVGRRFGADPDIVGQSVGLGPAAYTIVGVMPEKFAFPTYHSFWIPWRLDAAAYAPRNGPSINVFGRPAPGATLESTQAELTAISRRLAAASPTTHEHLRPLVIASAHAFNEIDDPQDALAVPRLVPSMLSSTASTGRGTPSASSNTASSLADPLRDLSASIDPDVQLLDVSTAEIAFEQAQGMMRLIGVSLALVILSVILLSSAGIYSLLSFTVARRRREIGIRAALGANRNRILLGIFSRVLAQLGAGAVLGLIAAVGLEQILEGDMMRNYRVMLLPFVVVLTMTIGVIAAIGPARQGLRIQPIEALRDE